MKKILPLIALLFLAAPAFGMSNDDLRALIDKPRATAGDAVLMVASIANPDATLESLNLASNKRLAKLDVNEPLTVGTFAMIAIELKQAHGGWFYAITGMKRYAVDAMQMRGQIPAQFTGGRALSGIELIELVRALIPSADQ